MIGFSVASSTVDVISNKSLLTVKAPLTVVAPAVNAVAESVKAIVPAASGNDIVLSAVGFVMVSLVS